MNRAEKAALQLRAVEILRVLKRTRTYEELAADLGLPAGDLNRYVNGHVLPGESRAQEIIDEVGLDLVRAELRDRIGRDEAGYFNTSAAVFDQGFLSMVSRVVSETEALGDPDVVLTAATDGITLAAAFADAHDARTVYAKKRRETAVEDFYQTRERLDSGIELTYYLPETAISAGEAVLVVDDLIRSGDTQELLLDLVDAAAAKPTAVFTLVAAGESGLSATRARVDGPVTALATLD